MKPKDFPEANFTWKGYPTPSGKPTVGDLVAFRDDRETVSLWKMSFRERWSALFFGKVWIRSMTGDQALQPLDAFVTRQPFEAVKVSWIELIQMKVHFFLHRQDA